MHLYPHCLILRHGETAWNREGRIQGERDSPLTALGRAQAAAQGRILAGLGTGSFDWIVSPQGRAQATARIAAGPGATLRTDARLAEISMGDWSGMLRAELAAANPALFESEGLAWYDHAPGGEGLEALARRTRALLDDLTGPAILVTHGITSRMLRCHLQGLPPEAFETVGGGQGVVYALSGGAQRVLREEA
ncbi:MAG: histidine phosphatase family protein [Pseudomonadota bacterium]